MHLKQPLVHVSSGHESFQLSLVFLSQWHLVLGWIPRKGLLFNKTCKHAFCMYTVDGLTYLVIMTKVLTQELRIKTYNLCILSEKPHVVYELEILFVSENKTYCKTYPFQLQHFFRSERGQDLPQTNTVSEVTFAKSLQKSDQLKDQLIDSLFSLVFALSLLLIFDMGGSE